jgi:hypothetical protein
MDAGCKFFEQDHITLYDVYPALKELKRYLRDEVTASEEVAPEYAQCCQSMAEFLQTRRVRMLDHDLIKVTFWLTSFGCKWLADGHEYISDTHRLHLCYQAPRTIRHIWALELMLPENTPPESPDEVDLGIEDCPYTGDAITYESLDDHVDCIGHSPGKKWLVNVPFTNVRLEPSFHKR